MAEYLVLSAGTASTELVCDGGYLYFSDVWYEETYSGASQQEYNTGNTTYLSGAGLYCFNGVSWGRYVLTGNKSWSSYYECWQCEATRYTYPGREETAWIYTTDETTRHYNTRADMQGYSVDYYDTVPYKYWRTPEGEVAPMVVYLDDEEKVVLYSQAFPKMDLKKFNWPDGFESGGTLSWEQIGMTDALYDRYLAALTDTEKKYTGVEFNIIRTWDNWDSETETYSPCHSFSTYRIWNKYAEDNQIMEDEIEFFFGPNGTGQSGWLFTLNKLTRTATLNFSVPPM